MKFRDKIVDALTPWTIIAIFGASAWVAYATVNELLNYIKNLL